MNGGTRGALVRRRIMLAVAGGLVVVLGVDPMLLGSTAGRAAVAAEPGVIAETRAQNLGVAAAALGLEAAAESNPLIAPDEEPDAPSTPLSLPVGLPAEAQVTVELGGGSQLRQAGEVPPVPVDLGGMAVTVAPSATGASPTAVTLRVADEVEAQRAGVSGVLVALRDASEQPAADAQEVELSISYAGFAGIGGGDWASRLRTVWIPDCSESEQTAPECRPIPIDSELDPIAQTLTFTAPVSPPDGNEAGADDAATGDTGEQTDAGKPGEPADPVDEGTDDQVEDSGTEEPAPDTEPETPAEGEGESPSVEVTDPPAESEDDEAAPAILAASPVGAAASGSVAVTSSVAGPLGNWSATGLSPTSTWSTSGATGAFTWAYPMRVPSVVAGPAPELALSYSSAVSDGRVPSANNQAGTIGEGFDLSTSYVERSYLPCTKDEAAGANNAGLFAPDLCWGPENATLSFNGSATELVKDPSSGTWHPKRDDGTRIELVPSGGAEGEYWKVTTIDGVQYFFGREATAKSAWTVPVYGNHASDPCYQATFADSQCSQVWRWNLDHVIDPSGNTASYFYTTETNRYRPYYGTEPVSYVAGGALTRIEYGTHADDGVAHAPAKVEFVNSPRCITDLSRADSWCTSSQNSTSAHHWPDTPVDLICAAGAACETYTPTFFNRTRLSKISTFAHDGTSYQPVDSWSFAQSFVRQDDDINLQYATGIMLRLNAVTHLAQGGALPDVSNLPAVKFDYTTLKNRVDAPDDGADALYRHRVSSIRTESGGRISVNYLTGCETQLPSDASANDQYCFPVKWHQEGDPQPRTDYFHKYLVASVVEGHTNREPNTSELITGSLAVVTNYEYLGGAKWAKPTSRLIPDADKTHSEFRGAAQVATIVGEAGTRQTKTVTTYYRGAGGTLTAGPAGSPQTVNDNHERFTGQVFSSAQFNGSKKVSESITVLGTPVTVATSAGDPSFKATRIPSQDVRGYTYNTAGTTAVLETKSTITFNEYGQPTTVDDRGDVGTAADNICVTTRYAHQDQSRLAERHLVALPGTVETTKKACGEQVNRPADVVSASKASYDDAGRAVKTEVLDPKDGDGYILSATAKYDERGRVTEAADALGQVTKTAYAHSAGGLLQSTTLTNPLGHTTSSIFDPILGVPLSSTDANGRKTTGTYDALGRLLTVRYPQHASTQHPSVQYLYSVDARGLNSVITKTISADGKKQHASAVLYDALLRPFQTQTEGKGTGQPSLGRMVAHTTYDSAGRIIEQTEPWWVNGAVQATPERKPADTVGHTTFAYDDAGRQTAKVFWVGTDSNPAYEKWRTVTHYDGATTLQIPPMGGVPTATTVDARGRTAELTQYHRDPEQHAGAVTATQVLALSKSTTRYEYDPAGYLAKMTDPKGNIWSYSYDWAGQQVAASDPDSGATSTTYDVLGRVQTRTNGNGQTLGYTYDALGRTTSVRDGSPTGAVRATWAYDTVLKGVVASATRVSDGHNYVTKYEAWDAAYRPTKTSVELPNTSPFTSLGSRVFTTEQKYTVDGQLRQISYPAVTKADGTKVLAKETVTTSYDAASSMPSWMGGGFGWGVYVAASRFDADGRPLLADLGNTYGAVVSYRYEQGTKRLTGISLDRERIDGTELDLSYAYDQAGNVTSLKDAPTNVKLAGEASRDNQCFSYDGLIRLESAWTAKNGNCAQAPSAGAMGGAAPYWAEYSYDVLGNRTQLVTRDTAGTATTSVSEYGAGGAGPHQLTKTTTGSSTTSYRYDEAGNRVSHGAGTTSSPWVVATPYEWDVEGELVKFGNSTFNSNRFVYDADGNRLVRHESIGSTLYLGGQEVRFEGVGGVSATRYYEFAGQTVAVRTGRGLGSAVTSLIADAHGTPVAAVPNGGHPAKTPVQRLYTDPFGATRGPSNAATVPGDIQFLGKTRDDQSGLTLLGARYYDETTGAFISVDPILDLADPQQWNAYAYAGNNPVTRSDPSGLLAIGATDHTDIRGKRVTPGEANGTVQSSSPTVVPPVETPTAASGVLVGAPLAASPWGAAAAEWLFGAITWSGVGTAGAAGLVLSMSGDSSNARQEAQDRSAAGAQSTPAMPPGDDDCPAIVIDCAGYQQATNQQTDAKGGVYTLRDEAGNVVRTGRSK